MPRPPDFFDKVNIVIDVWSNPCDAPWYVYVETVGPAALQMVITLFCFDIDDLIRWIFRPANLWPMRAARRKGGRRGGRRRRGLGARVRALIPGLGVVKGRKVSNGVKTLWRIDEIGQRLLWWWLVVDATTTFAYNWTSAIYKSEKCQLAAASGAGAAEGDGRSFGGPFPPLSLKTDDIKYSRGSVTMGTNAAGIGPGTHRVFGTVEGEGMTADASTAQLYINVIGGPAPYNAQIDNQPFKDGDTVGLVGGGEAQGPAEVRVLCGTAGGWVSDTHCTLVVAGVSQLLPPDTYACWMQELFRD